MRLLLDTCALLWLVADKARLSAAARQALQQTERPPAVSGVSAFEIASRYRAGALRLPMPPDDWYREALKFHGVIEIPITGAIAGRAAMLPPLHEDYCDRTIVATALDQGLTVVTPDPAIRCYDGLQSVW